MSSCRVFLVAVLWIPSAAAAAAADDEAATEKAQALVDRGQELFDAGDFEGARRAFSSAQELVPKRANPHRLLARAEARLGHCTEARREFATFLRLISRTDPRRKERRSIEEQCKQAESANAKAQPATPPVAQPAPAPAPLPPPAAPPAETAPPGPVVAPVAASAEKPADLHPGRTMKIAGIATGGAGVAAVAVGITFGVLAKSASDAVTNMARNHQPFDPSKQSAGQRDQVLEAVFIAVGAAAIGAGATLYWLGHRKATRARAMALVPALSPGGAGAVVRLVF